MRLVRVRRRFIISVTLSLIFLLLFFFYLFSRPIPARETAWDIRAGKDKITRFEFLSWFDQDARLYTLSSNQNHVVLAPSSAFYVFPWLPSGKKEGRYVWNLNLNTLSLKPILYETFIAFNPQLPGKLPKRLKELLQQQLDYETAKKPPLPHMVMEVIRFNAKDSTYEAKLSVSGFHRLQRRRFGTEFGSHEPRGWHTGVYYSGTMYFEIYSQFQPNQPLIILTKKFQNWDYPLRRNHSKVNQPSFIGTFCKLYALPDSKPIFMISSKVYKGLYQGRRGIDDEAFSVIVP
jgi:hypothetical protein